MHLLEILERHASSPARSVPEWTLGCFKRRSITFANGLTDTQTQVFWLQGRNLTIDLRLPIDADLIRKPWMECNQEEQQVLANYEGWSADSLWQDQLLSWSGGTALQLHNRWPEPARLFRVGDCMIELAPSGAYVEDWRLLSHQPGPLVSLRLIEERDSDSGELRHQGGALIITGNWAGLVLGRAHAIATDNSGMQLRERLNVADNDPGFKTQAFNFETSVARGSLAEGFHTAFSTHFSRSGQTIFPLDGFSVDPRNKQLVQHFTEGKTNIERRFEVDSLEQHYPFTCTSQWTPEALTWFKQEGETLCRYLKPLS